MRDLKKEFLYNIIEVLLTMRELDHDVRLFSQKFEN